MFSILSLISFFRHLKIVTYSSLSFKKLVEIFEYIQVMEKSEKQKWIILIIILTLGIGAALLNQYIG